MDKFSIELISRATGNHYINFGILSRWAIVSSAEYEGVFSYMNIHFNLKFLDYDVLLNYHIIQKFTIILCIYFDAIINFARSLLSTILLQNISPLSSYFNLIVLDVNFHKGSNY